MNKCKNSDDDNKDDESELYKWWIFCKYNQIGA